MRVLRGNPALPLLLVLLGGSILPLTAVAAGGTQHGGAVIQTGQGEQSIGSNATVAITGVTVNESVFRAGDTTFVWHTGANDSDATEYRIDVVLSAGLSDDYEVCRGSDACRPVRNSTSRQTVSFTGVEQGSNRTTFDLSVRRVADGTTVAHTTLAVWLLDRDADLDRDGVPNEREVEAGTSLVLGDTDDDGLGDERELALETDPTVADTDEDGLTDAREVDLGTNPTAADTDGDGLDDERELVDGTDPTAADTDDDGLTDTRELALGANATVPDTDGDGLVDGEEVALGATLTTADTDGDGLRDGREADLGSDPTAVDTDDDGLSDAHEVELGTDPTVEDTDDDGLGDGRELGLGSLPTVADTDGDGLGDAREVRLGTDPTVGDTDGDYLADGTETELGVNPTNPYTPTLYASGLLGFLLGIGVAVSTSEDGPRSWVTRAVPSLPERESATESETETTAPVTDSVRVTVEDRDEPDDSGPANAREVFERHQDALVTDAERTMRMLEAEGGKMRQSEIVESTSWSKAKVSRLLSKMDDDGDVVKVPIGRENLICLPENTPEPARQTDPAAASSAGQAPTATGG